MAQFIKNKYSPNFSIKKRPSNCIKYLIIHYTGMKKSSDAIARLSNPIFKVSCHFFIKDNGDLLRMVPENYIAWHAGKSKWKKDSLINKKSIGIEIQNPGHQHGYKKFNKKQIRTLLILLKRLKKKFKIKKENILGHSDIAPERKKDPGEKFPWDIMAFNKLCLWPNFNIKKIKKLRNIKVNQNTQKNFFRNLYKIGYRSMEKIDKTKSFKYLTIAFQRKYRNQLVNNKVDLECYLISQNLVKLNNQVLK